MKNSKHSVVCLGLQWPTEQADHLTFMLVRDCLIFITECNLLFSGFILDSDQRTLIPEAVSTLNMLESQSQLNKVSNFIFFDSAGNSASRNPALGVIEKLDKTMTQNFSHSRRSKEIFNSF